MDILDDLEDLVDIAVHIGSDDIVREAIDEIRSYRAAVFVLTRAVEELRNKQERRKPCGPLGLVDLKAKLSEFMGELDACEDEGQLAGLVEGSKRLLRQAEVDAKDWMDGPYDEPERGVTARIERTRERCKAAS